MPNFLQVALRDFVNVASLFPSSSFAVRSILKQIPKGSLNVVEYGPGDGVITRALLRHLPAESRVVSVEINGTFSRDLRSMESRRFTLIEGDVFDETERLREIFPEGVDVVVSGIPFSCFRRERQELLLRKTNSLLRTDGRFVVYQNSPRLEPRLRKYFDSVSSDFEPRNILPYFIMVGVKGN